MYETLLQKSDSAERFLRIFKQEYNNLVGRTATTNRIVSRNRKIVEIPSMNDVQILFTYLNNEVDLAKTALQNCSENRFRHKLWARLAQLVMVKLMLLNRRRPGDVQRIEVEDYNRLQSIDKESDAYKVIFRINLSSCLPNYLKS